MIEFVISFKGSSQKAISFPIPYQTPELFELSEQNPQLFIDTFNTHFQSILTNATVEQFPLFDKLILSKAKDILKSGTEDEQKVCQCLSNAISISSLLGMGVTTALSVPKFFGYFFPKFIYNNDRIPNLGFVLFRTGKSMNTKTKFERFILFINNKEKVVAGELFELLNKIYQGIRKVLTAGKLGENGMKLNNENTYNPPADGMNDIFKLIEGIINEIEEKEKIFYGIDCNANNYYNEETSLYEMEGMKKPIDSDGLIDFYIKLCTDHPLILYLEDPMAAKDLKGWSKLLSRFTAEKPNVKIVNQRSFNGDIDLLNELIEEKKEVDSDKPKEGEDAANKEGGESQANKAPLRTTDPNYRSRLINNVPRPDDVKEEMTPKELKKLEEERLEKEKLLEQQRLEEEEKKKAEEAAAASKKGPAKKEAPKAPAKKDDKGKGQPEEEKAAEKVLPLEIKNISMRLGNFMCITQMFDIMSKVQPKKFEISLYDNIVESEQSAISEIGFSCGIDNIILNGFTLRNDKMKKVIKYLNLLEEIEKEE